ncbi:MAG TPA: hypothetical protein VJ914_13470 [Pseudonocardiaceae bacterium]|nr:hypothetical protein [Pseudonocardiaceae bacterium]
MERPRTGHRHDQEGSIAVVDLIRRQSVGPVRIPSIEEADTEALLTELLGPEVEPGKHRGKMARAAKLVGLAVGSIVLCGSVAAAATLSRAKPPANTPAVAAPTPITGIGALRPDTLEAQLSGHAGGAPAHPAASHAPARTEHSANKAAAAANPPSSAPPAPAPTNPQQLVREFYQLVESQPAAAAQLLSPSLLATDPGGFITAWQSAAKVEVDSVQANADGTVQAVVRMLQPDGSWLRVVELLHVTQGSQPLISGAQLLSAQNG